MLTDKKLWDCRDAAVKVARGIVKNDADAEDVAQMVLVKLWQKYHDFKGSDLSLLKIARRLATNQSIDMLRSNSRQQSQQLELDFTTADDTLGDSQAMTLPESPDDILAAEEQKAAIQAAINDLPLPQVVAYFMYGDGRSFEEIAAYLKTNVTNARQLVSRANSELRWVADNY